jgi:hypothetical protein
MDPRLAPEGPQEPPAHRSARLARVATRCAVPPVGFGDDPLCRANFSQGGQFFVSPGGQFRMSFDMVDASRAEAGAAACDEMVGLGEDSGNLPTE